VVGWQTPEGKPVFNPGGKYCVKLVRTRLQLDHVTLKQLVLSTLCNDSDVIRPGKREVARCCCCPFHRGMTASTLGDRLLW
jgi:hypothetical protein